MTTITFAEFQADVENNRWHYGIGFVGRVPVYTSDTSSFLELPFPSSPGSVGFMADLFVKVSSRYYDLAEFAGATLWFTDAPWNNREHTGGQQAIDRIRAGFGDLRPFEWDHVYQFRRDEAGLLTTFAILGMVLAWDFYILEGSADQLVHASHDGFCGVFAKDEKTAALLRTRFERHWKGADAAS